MVDFNSIKVRLELGNEIGKKGYLTDFNSIKVRLEPDDEEDKRSLCLFQFHKGAIRTHSCCDVYPGRVPISIP